MIEAFFEEQETQALGTILMATSAQEGVDTSKRVRDYLNSLFPSDKYNEDFVEKYKDVVEEESDRVYKVEGVSE